MNFVEPETRAKLSQVSVLIADVKACGYDCEKCRKALKEAASLIRQYQAEVRLMAAAKSEGK